jgi:hypothetical protein
MSTREQYYRNAGDQRSYGCNGKVDYGSWSAAERVARRARQKGRSAGVVMIPYRCKICGGHHLSSLDGLERKRTKRDRRGEKERY